MRGEKSRVMLRIETNDCFTAASADGGFAFLAYLGPLRYLSTAFDTLPRLLATLRKADHVID